MIVSATEYNSFCQNSDKHESVAALNARICKLFGSIDGFFEFCNAKNPCTSAHQFKNRSSNKGGTTVKFIEVLELLVAGSHEQVIEHISRHKLYHEMCNERKRNRNHRKNLKQVK